MYDKERMKKPRLRRILLVAGLLLLCSGLLALAFALWPAQTAQVTATLPPTLFAPP